MCFAFVTGLFYFVYLSRVSLEERVPGAADGNIIGGFFRTSGNIDPHLHAELACNLVVKSQSLG